MLVLTSSCAPGNVAGKNDGKGIEVAEGGHFYYPGDHYPSSGGEMPRDNDEEYYLHYHTPPYEEHHEYYPRDNDEEYLPPAYEEEYHYPTDYPVDNDAEYYYDYPGEEESEGENILETYPLYFD